MLQSQEQGKGKVQGPLQGDDLRRYAALIRTHACTPLLEQVVAALRAQTWPPARIVFVDSSRNPAVREQLLRMGEVVAYPDEAFNYSAAINIGMATIDEPYALLISAHVRMESPTVLEESLTAAQTEGVEVVYWRHAHLGANGRAVIGPQTFDGYNGLSNACAYLPTRLVKERPFRTDVFSAEDQEWAAWYFRTRRGRVMRCDDLSVKYENPHVNARKMINEELAIAYFAYPRNRWPDRIASRLGRAALALLRGRRERARMHWEIGRGLFLMWFRAPNGTSKYF
ncbi:glycosyltransferase family 2 protein [Roseateles sp. SL47]|uniref:glycosyltransferase family 2 protein n=1 Tax=Roseateles sp. SL47 TaxID=2995138 RepID=UPI00226FC4BF|nr:glycosyltransferase family 2 protein [Roseateles sp. SL47]WAC75156.1 glycosyltransferase family 2 protein [Roseateles sp. SL47]